MAGRVLPAAVTTETRTFPTFARYAGLVAHHSGSLDGGVSVRMRTGTVGAEAHIGSRMRPNGDFMIEIRANRIVVAGDIDQVSVDDLERAIRALPGHRIDVDLGAVDHISWPGLRVLLDARVLHPQLRVV